MIIKTKKGREVQAARQSVIRTTEDACKVVGVSVPTLNKKEQNQDLFTVGELRALYKALGADGRDTIAAWLHKEFTGETIYKNGGRRV